MATGVVKFFKSEQGWGAITTHELPRGHDVFVHYSAIDASGFRQLSAGDRVEFDYEAVEQDNFHYVAGTVRLLP